MLHLVSNKRNKWTDYENYIYVKINLYIMIEVYRGYRKRKLLHNKFKQNGSEKLYIKINEVFGFGGAGNYTHFDRILKGYGNSRLSKEEVDKIVNTFAIGREWFEKGNKQYIEIPDLTLEDWKYFFNKRYNNKIPDCNNVSKQEIIIDRVEKAINDLIDSNIGKKPQISNPLYRMVYFFENGKKLSVNEEKRIIEATVQFLNEITISKWKIVDSEKRKEYSEVFQKLYKIMDSMDLYESYLK